MMDLQPSRRPAPRYTTATAVATPHQPRDAGRDILVRALGRGAIDGSDMLRIASCALDRGGVDRDLGASAVLPTLTAALTHGHGDLELRAAGGLARRSAVEHRATQRVDELIVGQMAAVFVVEHSAGLAQERE